MQLKWLSKKHCSSSVSQVGEQKAGGCRCITLGTSGTSCFPEFGFYQDSIISLPSSMFGICFVLEDFLHLVGILQMQALLGKTPCLLR